MYCISHDMETAVGLRLTGIETKVLEEKVEVDSEITKILKDEKIGILIVTKPIYEMSKSMLENIRQNKKMPLVVCL